MARFIVLGGQWGDEGKGKIVDLLTEHVDICARFAGGHNAGHTVKIGETTYPLHLIPCGILRPEITCVIGNGVVVEPGKLVEEIDQLAQQGIQVEGRLKVSDRAHLVLPSHPTVDQANEAARSGETKIGTTARGIGPTYSDKASRIGMRVVDLYDDDARERFEVVLKAHDRHLVAMGAQPEDQGPILEAYLGEGGFRDKLRPYVANTVEFLNRRIRAGARVLIEGAQGALLDIDHGTYPYVTSSNATSGGACTGLGVAPTSIDACFGVFKAYCTRVGGGPFPTELEGETGDTIRERGNEYGTTTGRPRRVGWFDAVAARYAVKLNGFSAIALTLLDVLDTFDELKVCTAYRHKGQTLTDYPSSLKVLEECEPVFRTMKGWNEPLSDHASLSDFPPAAREYLELLGDLLEVDIAVVSVGPERRRSIVREDTDFFRLLQGAD
jgi:adenylosuccinate synthase